MGGVRVVEPEVVLGAGQRLRELDDVPYVLGGDGGVGGGVAERRVVVQPVDHPVLAQVARYVDDQFRCICCLKKKRNVQFLNGVN